MYYASVGIIALIVHVIINLDMLKKVDMASDNLMRSRYRQFLFSIIAYFLCDIMWGFFYEQRWIIATYIDTCAYFFTMVLSVLLWTRSVIAFSGNKGRLGRIFIGAGWLVFLFELMALVINIFTPIVFSFSEDKEYLPLPARYITLVMQVVLFFSTAVYSFIVVLRSTGVRKSHYRTIGFSGIVMAIFIALQMFYPFMPFYAIGCLFSTCLIHTFVGMDLSVEREKKIKLAHQKAYRDALTGVKNKLAYLEALKDIEIRLAEGSLNEYGVVVFDLNDLKEVNDTLGHAEGDEYIKEASHTICQLYKHSPVFRIGGDEFVVILMDEDYENRERLRESFENIMDENKKAGKVVVSDGMAVYISGRDESYNDVFKRADSVMYRRKQMLKSGEKPV